MSVKLHLKENKAFFRDFAQKYEEQVEALVDDTLTDIETEASAAAKVDKGILRTSLVKEVEGMIGRVYTNVHYAPYVEFGTGGLVDIPNGLEEYAIQFKGAGVKQVNLPPRPFLFPAFFANTKKMLETLKKLDGTK